MAPSKPETHGQRTRQASYEPWFPALSNQPTRQYLTQQPRLMFLVAGNIQPNNWNHWCLWLDRIYTCGSPWHGWNSSVLTATTGWPHVIAVRIDDLLITAKSEEAIIDLKAIIEKKIRLLLYGTTATRHRMDHIHTRSENQTYFTTNENQIILELHCIQSFQSFSTYATWIMPNRTTGKLWPDLCTYLLEHWSYGPARNNQRYYSAPVNPVCSCIHGATRSIMVNTANTGSQAWH